MKARATVTIEVMGDEIEVRSVLTSIQQVVDLARKEGMTIERNDVRSEPIRRARKAKGGE